ncbi:MULTISPECIES: hypothetical protein [Hwangdonia]|uniref:Uncharacterized protein n=1 Tax=Hwangdonia seohaensis TaxID=1240727 RepID=A0ABW3R997_9FLAO|nr:hypothetical protein [Hwangdonia seohaensis]
MKYIIIFFLVVSIGLITSGFLLETAYSQQLIGFGVVTLFLIVFPLFSYYRWKDKKIQDYMLTKENLDKMREREGDKRK